MYLQDQPVENGTCTIPQDKLVLTVIMTFRDMLLEDETSETSGYLSSFDDVCLIVSQLQ